MRERVDRAVAGGDQAVLPPGLPQRVPQRAAVLGRGVQLPAELADVRDAQRQQGHAADGDLAGGQVREAGVGHVVARVSGARMSRARGPHRP